MTTPKTSITIASLNLWCFYDWEKRLPAIISLLKGIKPDILLTQETQHNLSLDKRNQLEIINAELGYPFVVFAPAYSRDKQKDHVFKHPVPHGLGVLSRFPLSTEIIPLTQAGDGKEPRIILKCNVDIEGKTHTITNLHFSNSIKGSEEHFKETLAILKKKQVTSILAGDFNIFTITDYKELYGDEYVSSSEKYKYISYPKDNVSFDYVLLPRQYEFEEFVCREEYVSDHRMIVAKIKLN